MSSPFAVFAGRDMNALDFDSLNQYPTLRSPIKSEKNVAPDYSRVWENLHRNNHDLPKVCAFSLSRTFFLSHQKGDFPLGSSKQPSTSTSSSKSIGRTATTSEFWISLAVSLLKSFANDTKHFKSVGPDTGIGKEVLVGVEGVLGLLRSVSFVLPLTFWSSYMLMMCS
jgi:hypothetical protein